MEKATSSKKQQKIACLKTKDGNFVSVNSIIQILPPNSLILNTDSTKNYLVCHLINGKNVLIESSIIKKYFKFDDG